MQETERASVRGVAAVKAPVRVARRSKASVRLPEKTNMQIAVVA